MPCPDRWFVVQHAHTSEYKVAPESQIERMTEVWMLASAGYDTQQEAQRARDAILRDEYRG